MNVSSLPPMEYLDIDPLTWPLWSATHVYLRVVPPERPPVALIPAIRYGSLRRPRYMLQVGQAKTTRWRN